jgi:Family of unknown function (DUF5329)
MLKRLTPTVLLLLGLAAVSPVGAQSRAGMQPEVDSLLSGIERSGCEFYRNGTWHNGHEAQLHLRDKFDYLVARHQIDSAEQFIDRAATKSSFSGRAYRVRCDDGVEVSSQQWMHGRLAQLRRSR